MKKNVKKIVSTVLLLTVVLGTFLSVVVYGDDRIPGIAAAPPKAKTIAQNVLGLVQAFAYAIAVGMVMYLGIKYMMAPANEKADLKNASIKYVTGAILACAAVTVANMLIEFGQGMSTTASTTTSSVQPIQKPGGAPAKPGGGPVAEPQ